jgi:hypothetical protein
MNDLLLKLADLLGVKRDPAREARQRPSGGKGALERDDEQVWTLTAMCVNPGVVFRVG